MDILIPLTVGVIIAIVAVISNRFIRRQGTFWQVILYSALVFIFLFLIACMIKLYYEASWELLSLILLLGFGASVLTAVATYFNITFVRWKAGKLRERYSMLPDGPEKERLMEMLKQMEGHQKPK